MMINMDTKKITSIIKSSVFSLIVLLVISACDIVTVDEAEDSGFEIRISNYSNTEYNNCTFYMGYKDKKDNFIKSDSLVFKDIIIYKKGDGNHVSENGFSVTYPFSQSKKGLNKFGIWSMTPEVESAFYENGEIFFKVDLEGKISISSPKKHRNGGIVLQIFENGELIW